MNKEEVRRHCAESCTEFIDIRHNTRTYCCKTDFCNRAVQSVNKDSQLSVAVALLVRVVAAGLL